MRRTVYLIWSSAGHGHGVGLEYRGLASCLHVPLWCLAPGPAWQWAYMAAAASTCRLTACAAALRAVGGWVGGWMVEEGTTGGACACCEGLVTSAWLWITEQSCGACNLAAQQHGGPVCLPCPRRSAAAAAAWGCHTPRLVWCYASPVAAAQCGRYA